MTEKDTIKKKEASVFTSSGAFALGETKKSASGAYALQQIANGKKKKK